MYWVPGSHIQHANEEHKKHGKTIQFKNQNDQTPTLLKNFNIAMKVEEESHPLLEHSHLPSPSK